MLDDNLGIHVEVEEVETGHKITKSKGPSDGEFIFTSHEAGDHSICLSTNHTSWGARPDTEHDHMHVSEVAAKVRDLNQNLEHLRREQQYQREGRQTYRDLSESTNLPAVWHLKNFFEDRKLR
ncbi:hypothetical protein BDP27DRAFT_1366467 [Rhodocollybia butyracea]|uniref:GOLD domain-containing protein n=1 Tax=Rhodocollybia butyracea TaxID=206335 RepID=A0A9P5U348_9AGAR|nr:hypothetical protein BDP27DRAFT_1366467 [Rhodocollybia butyracea]